MAQVRARAGRRPPRSYRQVARDALVAAGEPSELVDASVETTYELTQGGPADRFFNAAAIGSGATEYAGRSWPCDVGEILAETGEPVFRDGNQVVYRLDDGQIVLFSVGNGWAYVRVAASARETAGATVAAFAALYPATYLDATDERVPVTFWMDTPHGPTRRLRMIDASPWADVADNYPPAIREILDGMMLGFEPGKGGQLLLWQGTPGTGKTWALRALVSEWLPWAEFHYITDPDAFFVENPSYMVDVLLADTYEALSVDGDVYQEGDENGKWRVLILEDTGELLSANAKEKYGQGLSRLLNVVDGMIGQGLRVLCLVTTNDELGELTPAVRRPGRCAVQLVFDPFSPEEASEWLGAEVEEQATIAELYARRGDAPAEALDADVEPEVLVAAAETADILDAIRAVAAAHQEEAVGYGETAFDAATATVLYVCGDWTDADLIAADFLAIDGVDAFVHEAEALPAGWFDAQVVYPENPPRWVTERPEESEAALSTVVALASKPLG